VKVVRLNKILFLVLAALWLPAAARANSVYENQSDVGTKLCIPVHRWNNTDQPIKGVIVALQGLIFSGKLFAPLASHFNEKGYVVYAGDMRGFGDWRTPNHNFAGDSAMHFGASKDDLTDTLKVLRKKYPDKPIFLVGESFGANLAVWETSTDPALMDGAIASGFVAKTRVHPRPLWVKTFFQGIYNPNNSINIAPYMKPVLSEDKKVAKELMESSETVKEMSVTNLIKANITNTNSLKDIAYIPESMPVLIMAGEKDKVQKTEALAEILPKLGSKNATLVTFSGKGHMLLECQHIDQEVAQAMDNWIDKQQTAYEEKLATNARQNLSTTAKSVIESTVLESGSQVMNSAETLESSPADAFSKSSSGRL